MWSFVSIFALFAASKETVSLKVKACVGGGLVSGWPNHCIFHSNGILLDKYVNECECVRTATYPQIYSKTRLHT